MPAAATKVRCTWALGDPLMMRYHDTEWGVPAHDDRTLFEFLLLEGAQAGLSWRTILTKRENYRRAFAGFDPQRVARFDAAAVRRLMSDEGIVRNRLKIAGAIRNARALLDVREEWGSFDAFVWRFVDGHTLVNRRRRTADLPASTAHSDALSKALKEAGFTFVGTTICYAFMQAVGMVDDHLLTCFRHRKAARRDVRPERPSRGSRR
jgi:DNA-3-methyladenine glycosylase I